MLDDLSNTSWLLARSRSFYESLCTALLNRIPEMGVRLFKNLRNKYQFQLSDSATEIDSLLFCLFAVKDSEPVLSLRYELIERCKSDKDLLEFTFLAQFYGHQEWLFEKIGFLLGSERAFDQARGLTLLGVMDDTASGAQLQEWIDNNSESWIRNRAEMALRLHQRNTWARKWFDIFLSHENDLQAWAAFRLLQKCIDRRFWLWGPRKIKTAEKSNRVDYYNANKDSLRKAALKNEKDTLKLEKRLVFSDIQEKQVWPWMDQYF